MLGHWILGRHAARRGILHNDVAVVARVFEKKETISRYTCDLKYKNLGNRYEIFVGSD